MSALGNYKLSAIGFNLIKRLVMEIHVLQKMHWHKMDDVTLRNASYNWALTGKHFKSIKLNALLIQERYYPIRQKNLV